MTFKQPQRTSKNGQENVAQLLSEPGRNESRSGNRRKASVFRGREVGDEERQGGGETLTVTKLMATPDAEWRPFSPLSSLRISPLGRFEA